MCRATDRGALKCSLAKAPAKKKAKMNNPPSQQDRELIVVQARMFIWGVLVIYLPFMLINRAKKRTRGAQRGGDNASCTYNSSYTQQLQGLQACTPTSLVCLPAALVEITTPLISTVRETELANHPDHVFTSYVVNGIKHGFRVGYDRSKTLKNCTSNMVSALQHPDVVPDYLKQELLLNHMVVIPPAQVPYIHCHISPFGVIPKKAKPAHS